MSSCFPDRIVRRAFTSPITIGRIERREGIQVDDLETALRKLSDQGVEEVTVFPTQVVEGFQMDQIREVSDQSRRGFERLSVVPPLLSTDGDMSAFLDELPHVYPDAFASGSALVMMGHGSSPASIGAFRRLQELADAKGIDAFFIVPEGGPVIGDVIPRLRSAGKDRVCLAPLMFEAGYHAKRDMASEKGPIRSVLIREGFGTEAVMLGLSEIDVFRRMFLEHLREFL